MIRKVLALFVVLGIWVGLAGAQVQAGLGAVAGIVTDPTKAAIPGAHVVLTNPGTGYSSETTTNSSGEFSFKSLTVVGGYQLVVTAPGFARAQVSGFATSVGTIVNQNVTLALGSETTTIEVKGTNEEQVQVDTSSVSQLIDSTTWQNAPLSVRSSNTFVGLVAGAATDSANTGRGFAVNGARTGTGNFMVDGFDNNDQGLGGGNANGGGGGEATMSPDAIQEYRVITSVPNAEYGRAGGFATDTVLKSGTNQFHGSLFEYNRIQALAQNNWFSKASGLQDHLVRNQFGGSVGGPIYKDKTFFYATVEFQRMSTGNPTTFTALTQDFYNYVKSGAYEKWMEGTADQNAGSNPGDGSVGLGFCPAVLGKTCAGQLPDLGKLGATFTQLYSKYPAQFPFATSSFTNEPTDLLLDGDFPLASAPDSSYYAYLPVNIYGQASVISTEKYAQNRGSMKLDHKLTERDQLSFTYLADLDTDSFNDGGGGPTPGPPYQQVGGAQIFGARWSHTFTPNLLNDFRAGYNRHVSNFAATGVDGIADIYTADSLYTGFGAYSGFPQLFTENAFSYEDAVTYTRGHHTAKAGFRFLRTRNGSSFYNDNSGTVGFWGAPGLLTDGLNEQDVDAIYPDAASYGTLYYASASLDPTTNAAPDPYRGYRANEFAAYVQDDWKATPRLTLNYGLRWDYFGPPHNFKAGVDSNVYFGTGSFVSSGNPFEPNAPLLVGEQGATFQYAQSNGRSTIWDRDLNNFGPRFGFAYDTFGNSKLVLRGGFGIGYDRLYNNVYENIRFNGPRFVDNAYGFGAGNGVLTPALRAQLVPEPFAGNVPLAVAGAAPVPRHVNQNLKTAYYEQIHFGVETQVAHSYVVEANYIGTLGRQLVGIMNINTFEGRAACTSSSSATQKALCKAAGYTTLSSARPSSLFGNDNFRTNGFSSNYSGGQISVRRGYANGLQLSANYTYSKALDEISDVFTVKGGATGITTPYNPSHSYGPADFDVRHQATVTAYYETRSQTHKLLLAGWSLAPILKMHSGTPIYIKSGNSSYDPNKDGTTGVEPAVYGGTGSIRNSINHSASPSNGWIKPKTWVQYTCPTSVNSGLFCDVPGDRSSLYGLRQYNLDVAISKKLQFSERLGLQLQAAFFDVDGHPEFSNPAADINNTSTFGSSQSLLSGGSREGQLSARIEF